jgi:hypothetical protein
MNPWILDTAIARLLSSNAVVLTEPPDSQIVGNLDAGLTDRDPSSRRQNLN